MSSFEAENQDKAGWTSAIDDDRKTLDSALIWRSNCRPFLAGDG